MKNLPNNDILPFRLYEKIIFTLNISDETQQLLDDASHIKQTGVTGAYSKEFADMEEKLEQVRMTLADANITGSDIEDLRDIVDMLRCVLCCNSL